VIRHPWVAGRFYPAERTSLLALVNRLLREARSDGCEALRGLIVPHAGYAYSGACAAEGYASLSGGERPPRRVAVLGTCHTQGVTRMILTTAVAFETPLGRVDVDRQRVEGLSVLADTEIDDEIHSRDHAIEVQLPFLQVVLGSFELIPVLVGRVAISSAIRAIDWLWSDVSTLVLVSSDLSHYLPDDVARRVDGETAEAIVALEPDRITRRRACGYRAIQALVSEARERGLCARTLDLRTSADAGGSRERVVGYGAFAFVDDSGARSGALDGM
jgi:AmmeMemoRadiSam system protein B